jgi:hypothetical protein
MSILTVQAGVCTIRRPYPQKTVERISPGVVPHRLIHKVEAVEFLS